MDLGSDGVIIDVDIGLRLQMQFSANQIWSHAKNSVRNDNRILIGMDKPHYAQDMIFASKNNVKQSKCHFRYEKAREFACLVEDVILMKN